MSGYEKTIVCLANSRKESGRCVAGKTVDNGKFGDWVRPVSSRPTNEISEEERRYADGSRTKLLDIVSIPMKDHCPAMHQQENHLIHNGEHWRCLGVANWHFVETAVDRHLTSLWANGDSSSNGTNDRVSASVISKERYSLALIRPESLVIRVMAEGARYGDNRNKVRALFQFREISYGLMVTDPETESAYLELGVGEYESKASDSVLCVSLGELFHGYYYKLVAAIITPEAAGN